MRRMDGLSAFMLEQERTGAYMHTLKVSILDASDIPDCWEMINHYCEAFAEYAELLDATEEREAIAARFRGHEHSLLETSPA
jgi:hypothetical protein